MRAFVFLSILAYVSADKGPGAAPLSAPVQKAAPVQVAADTYGSPVAAPVADEYGSPQAAPVNDEYGSPQAAPVSGGDAYGSPAADPVAAAPAAGNTHGYYYYYYPVKDNAAVAAPAYDKEDDNGLLGDLFSGNLFATLLTKKIVLVALGLGAVLFAIALGVNFSLSLGRSFDSAMPYLTEDNLVALADFVSDAFTKYNN